MQEKIDIADGAWGEIRVKIAGESPAFENQEFNVLLLQPIEYRPEVMAKECPADDALIGFRVEF